MGTVKIVTDSPWDLPISFIEECDTAIVPSNANFNGTSYLDGSELSPESFFKLLPAANPLPTTSNRHECIANMQTTNAFMPWLSNQSRYKGEK